MATYKVIQDIEAEDKLLGPLTLRQFIYAGITVVLMFIDYKLASISIVAIIPLFLPIILFGALAIPFGRDQPNEIWLLARVRFFLKPRRRIWKQGGYQELVKITAPAVVARQMTKNFSETEAKSRLKALANTIDTRGWAVKNVGVNMYNQPDYMSTEEDSDRLINVSTLPQDVPSYDVTLEDDILDNANPTSQHLAQAIEQNEHEQRQYHETLVDHPESKDNKQTKQDYWFMNQPTTLQASDPRHQTFSDLTVYRPGDDDDESTQNASITPQLAEKIKKAHQGPNPAYGHTHVLEPLSKTDTGLKKSGVKQSDAQSKKVSSLAADNNKSVATIASEAKKRPPKDDLPEEVVVSLH
ncbi:MAG TPA: PrgI family protein [Candidatus Saccharimonadales bacterium]|nr:PrgI family protein [Candidatus Saccharimonadales bacterium]